MDSATNTTEKRLWVGNLDPRINEYHLLKIMQKYGCIEKFDLLFYRTGPQAGQPRGYAFITYTKIEDAITAKDNLHNKLIGNKRIVVKWAHSITDENKEKQTPHLEIPVLAGAPKTGKRTNRESQIQAIEAKLKFMERSESPDFAVVPPANIVPTQVSKTTRTNKAETSHTSDKSNRRRLFHEKRKK